MVAYNISLAPPLRKPARPATRPQGFARGTLVRTIFGQRPVERLMAGDLLLDTDGQLVTLRALRQVRVEPEDLVRIAPGEAAPGLERALIVGADQKLALRDWRTDLIYGSGVMACAAQMVDGRSLRQLKVARQLFQLEVGSDCVIHANGLPALLRGSAQGAQHGGQRLGQVFGDQAGADLARGLDMQPGARRCGLGHRHLACHQPGDQARQHIA